MKWEAPIGLFPEEKHSPNRFELDVDVDTRVPFPGTLPFFDYVELHRLADQVMRQPGELLETYVQALAQAIQSRFPEARRIQVRLRKLHPPFPGETAYAQVSLDWVCEADQSAGI